MLAFFFLREVRHESKGACRKQRNAKTYFGV